MVTHAYTCLHMLTQGLLTLPLLMSFCPQTFGIPIDAVVQVVVVVVMIM